MAAVVVVIAYADATLTTAVVAIIVDSATTVVAIIVDSATAVVAIATAVFVAFVM